ncbi:MAG: magnesium transporter [Nitrososphaerota archaeon]|nr:magnesium transporter [Nitrososphaerota archaeon]
MLGIYKTISVFKQSLAAYLFNIFGLLAGIMVAYNFWILTMVPWGMIIYPQILSARGVIGGILSGRLGTALHLGTIYPRLRKNTKSFYFLLKAMTVLTVEASIAMSLLSIVFAEILSGAGIYDVFPILGVVLATMTLALAIVSPLTVSVSFLSFRYGLDPDVVLYPIESTVSDCLITLCYLTILKLYLFTGSFGFYLIIMIATLLFVLSLYSFYSSSRDREFRSILKETFMTMLFVALIVNITGSIMGKISETIGNRPEIYTVYPALIDTVGDIGAVIGSTATTKLALGTLSKSFSAIKEHVSEVVGAWMASIVMFIAYSFISITLCGVFSFPIFIQLLRALLMTNILAAMFIIVVSWITCILTFKHGLDPDNFIIPIESSLADSITTTSLFTALIICA